MTLKINTYSNDTLYSGIKIKNLLKTNTTIGTTIDFQKSKIQDSGEGIFAAWNKELNHPESDTFKLTKIEQKVKTNNNELNDLISEVKLSKWRREVDKAILNLKKKRYKV